MRRVIIGAVIGLAKGRATRSPQLGKDGEPKGDGESFDQGALARTARKRVDGSPRIVLNARDYYPRPTGGSS